MFSLKDYTTFLSHSRVSDDVNFNWLEGRGRLGSHGRNFRPILPRLSEWLMKTILPDILCCVWCVLSALLGRMLCVLPESLATILNSCCVIQA